MDAVRGGRQTHQGFPVVDGSGMLVGVVTRRDLLKPDQNAAATIGEVITRDPVVVFEDSTLRDAADQMVIEQVGRLPVVNRANPRIVTGMISRSDLLAAHGSRLVAAHKVKRVRRISSRKSRKRKA